MTQIQPHKQYTIHFEDLGNANPLAPVIEVGWRFFEWTNDGTLGARILWVRNDESGFVYCNIGRFVAGSIIGFQAAEILQSRVDYYFRVLGLPQIHVFAIWLHRAGGDTSEAPNLLIPIYPTQSAATLPPPSAPLEPFIPYTAERFFELIKTPLDEAGQEPEVNAR